MDTNENWWKITLDGEDKAGSKYLRIPIHRVIFKNQFLEILNQHKYDIQSILLYF